MLCFWCGGWDPHPSLPVKEHANHVHAMLEESSNLSKVTTINYQKILVV